KQDPYGSAKLLLLTLPPLLLLLLFMGSALPREDYTQPLPVQLLRKDLTQRAQLWGRDLVTGNLTGHLAESDDAETDLSQAGPLRFTGRTALRVESEKTGHIYLRGCSAGIYEDSKWLQIPAEAYPQMDYQPLNFPALAHPNRAATRVVVENVAAPGTFVYTPYQLLTTPERMGGAEFVTDAYLARRDGIWRHILYVRDKAKPGLVLYGAAAEAERTYAQFVREQYLLVPQALQNKLRVEPLRGEPDPLAAAQAVAERLAELAVYDPETPAAPPGEDFVLQFLAEKRGYCMHFATVATLMLRELGVPARYVTGYVADTVAGQVVDVPDYNAHAWVEVYCDGFGWQPVEVTPGFSGDFPWTAAEAEPTPTPTPKPSAAPTPVPTKPDRPPEEIAAPEGQSQWLLWLPLCLLTLLGAALLRRRLAEGSRRRKFGAADPNRAVLDLYGYALRVLGWSGGKMVGVILALAQRAK
ncbi:MAG: transglutaminase domain-containing protein, partial [Pseudoflavonifractor sp.]